jgi:hypothetical protein
MAVLEYHCITVAVMLFVDERFKYKIVPGENSERIRLAT